MRPVLASPDPLLLRLFWRLLRPKVPRMTVHRWVALPGIPLYAGLLWGIRYFTDWRLFVCATLLLAVITLLYTNWSGTLTDFIYRRYGEPGQAARRVGILLLALPGPGLGITFTSLWLFDATHLFGFRYNAAITPWIGLSTVLFDAALISIFELTFAFRQWQTHQLEAERLAQQHLQRQLTAMKQQVNPHFLFNSLSSLSVLIGEDPQEAERFVDELARVYRYLLQAHRATADGAAEEPVPLEAELRFLHSYAYLLRTRYGAGLHVELAPAAAYPPGATLLPLTLQTLVDNAIRHNALSAGRPLRIVVAPAPDGSGLRVGNNVQPRTQRLALGREGLGELQARYQLLGARRALRLDTTAGFGVLVPLL